MSRFRAQSPVSIFIAKNRMTIVKGKTAMRAELIELKSQKEELITTKARAGLIKSCVQGCILGCTAAMGVALLVISL